MNSRIPDEEEVHSAADGSPVDGFRNALSHLRELREYFSYYVTAQLDSLKGSVRNAALYAVLGLVGAIAACTLLVSAVVLLCWGCAGAFAAIWGIWWLGYIIMGVLLLTLIGGGMWLALRRVTKGWRQATLRKYEQRRTEQELQYGHNVQERAVSH